ncbi:MAG: S8 family serine peptidase [Fidelibacterota bacterium]|nr:MAG: S8 family serine peptidase [Candidatus Neomarinimicrobiota bacterium]
MHLTLVFLTLVVLSAGSIPLRAESRGGDVRPVGTSRSAASRIVYAGRTPMVAGVIIVKMGVPGAIPKGSSRTGVPSLDKLLSQHGVYGIERAYPLPQRTLGTKADELRKIYRVWYGGGEDPRSMARTISRDAAVEYAVPWYVDRIHGLPAGRRDSEGGRASMIPNDPLYPQMTHLPHIQLPSAWEVAKGEDADVIIAIVDGGTDWQHEDLLDNIWQNLGEDADGDGHTLEYQDDAWILDPGDLNGIDDDDWDEDPATYIDDLIGWNFPDESGNPAGLATAPVNAEHGTAVAGVASAVTDNGVGISGAAWNAILMAINTTCETDTFICSGYDGVVYAAANGADIINASWGSTYADLSVSDERQLLRYAGDIIDFVLESGALLISSAGNENENNDRVLSLPAGVPEVLSVGAIGKSVDFKAGFSNYGFSVDVFAPGLLLNSTRPYDRYVDDVSGTSFSSPLVAGVAALVKTSFPGLTPDQLRQQVRVTADSIDDANPTYWGRMGKGRVNAYRAVTDTTRPAIRIVGVSYSESGGDGSIDNGDIIDPIVSLTNDLADASNLIITLTTTDPDIIITDGEATLASLPSGATEEVGFQFRLGTVGEQHPLRFVVGISADTYEDKEQFKLYANEPPFLTHDTGMLRVSITGEGNIGWSGFAETTSGEGFIYDGRNLLFEGGLLVGVSRSKVSDCIRGEGEVPDKDFGIPAGGQMVIIDGDLANEQGYVVLKDHLASAPIGLTINQESYADNHPDNDDFVIFRYIITNQSGRTLSDLYAGLFFDWDINSDASDYVRYDVARMMGRMQNHSSDPTILAATRLLSRHAAPLFRAISNPLEIYGGDTGDGFTAIEKWNFLSSGIQVQNRNNIDASTLTGAGPFSLAANESAEIAFAVVGAGSIQALEENADNAQEFWDTIIQPAQPNQAPAFTKVLTDTTITVTQTLTFSYSAEDPEGDDLSFSLMNPPSNASMDAASGILTYLPESDFTGTEYTADITVAVSDGQLVSTTSGRITVERIDNLLGQNYANPLSLSTQGQTLIDYQLAEECEVTLVVYDILGREVKTLVQGRKPTGKYTADWNGHDNHGRRVSTGIYLYRLQAGDFIEIRKITVLK